MTAAVSIVGAGPTGALLAILLHARGIGRIDLYESRADPRQAPAEHGRSINLALADRGIHALKVAGVFHRLGTALLPMRGRFIHATDGTSAFQSYGQRPNEEIYSISRHGLNQSLLAMAVELPGVSVHFSHRLEDADFVSGVATFSNLADGSTLHTAMQPMLAADGAASRMRRLMTAAGLIESHETDLEHGYKELTIPAAADGTHQLAKDALHIWPRGNFMLIALPNVDGSFTASLFLPKGGPDSFDSLQNATAIDAFLQQHFADVAALMPARVHEFEHNPIGFLGTVHARGWNHGGMVGLIGDAAHAIVPFHGQGMNCCFEDCVELIAALDDRIDWQDALTTFSAARKPNTDAIAQMAIDNYLEMRDRVVDPKYQLQRELALELERRYPQHFIPRYSMVMFHHDIPYADAQSRGAVQADILAALTGDPVTEIDQVDFARAARLVEAQLPPLAV